MAATQGLHLRQQRRTLPLSSHDRAQGPTARAAPPNGAPAAGQGGARRACALPLGLASPARSPRDPCLAQDGGNEQAWLGPRLSPRPSASPWNTRQELVHTVLTQAAPRAVEQVWPKLPISARPSSLLFLHGEAPIAGAWRILSTPHSPGLTNMGANGVWNFC